MTNKVYRLGRRVPCLPSQSGCLSSVVSLTKEDEQPLETNPGYPALKELWHGPLACAFIFVLFFASNILCAQPASPGEEQKLIAVLGSSASLKEKDAACARLKRIGTVSSIPALASLLTDKDLSHSARYALEPMSAPEAGKAMIDALGKTTGGIRIGIITSLAARGEKRAVPQLVQLLKANDSATACAAASALGQINSPDALKALEQTLAASDPALHKAAVDACLRSANRALGVGSDSQALSLYTRLYHHEKDEATRVAAYSGMIRSSGKRGIGMMVDAIRGQDSAGKLAALRLVPELTAADANKKLAALLPKIDPVTQAALLQGLGFREATEAAPEIVRLLRSKDASVRIAAANALGNAGGATEVGALAAFAAKTKGEEQAVAREALQNLRHGRVGEELLKRLETSPPQVQPELARALGARRDRAAVPKLLQLAQHGDNSARKGALLALPYLIGTNDLPGLVRLVVAAPSSEMRAAATECLNSSCLTLKASHQPLDSTSIIKGMDHASPEAQVALLSICGGFDDRAIASKLRDLVGSTDPKIRTAAIGAICDSTDAELLPDAVKLASTEQDPALRTRALQACVRITTQEETIKLSHPEKVEIYQTLFASKPNATQKKMLLAGLGEIPDAKAFDLVAPLVNDDEIRAEAQLAAVKIASGMSGPAVANATPVIKQIAESPANESIREGAKAVLSQFDSAADFLTAWQVSGPFRRKGSDYTALFDIPFGPENFKAPNVKWKRLPVSASPQNPRVMDLLKALGGGEQCVAYARTSIWSPQEQPARLELGSDDGLKVWLNGQVIHAQNTARPLTFASDKVDVTLKKGWNNLQVKVTQNNQGWEFCARLTKPDGGHLEGLKVEATPATQAASKEK
jgi:HEAT repeat protein